MAHTSQNMIELPILYFQMSIKEENNYDRTEPRCLEVKLHEEHDQCCKIHTVYKTFTGRSLEEYCSLKQGLARNEVVGRSLFYFLLTFPCLFQNSNEEHCVYGGGYVCNYPC